MMVFATVLCRMMWPNQESLRRFTVANKGSCLPGNPLVFTVANKGSCLPGNPLVFTVANKGSCLSGNPLVFSRVRLFCFSTLNAEESPEAFRFKCLYLSLCIC